MIENWIHLTQDRDKCLVLVNTISNLRVSEQAWIFLSNLATSSEQELFSVELGLYEKSNVGPGYG